MVQQVLFLAVVFQAEVRLAQRQQLGRHDQVRVGDALVEDDGYQVSDLLEAVGRDLEHLGQAEAAHDVWKETAEALVLDQVDVLAELGDRDGAEHPALLDDLDEEDGLVEARLVFEDPAQVERPHHRHEHVLGVGAALQVYQRLELEAAFFGEVDLLEYLVDQLGQSCLTQDYRFPPAGRPAGALGQG